MPSGEVQKRRTHCPNGHIYDAANTRIKITKEGHTERYCRACARVRIQRRRDQPGGREFAAAATRKWRSENREHCNKLWRDKRSEKKAWIDSHKLACVRCGEDHPSCLEFDHRIPAEKDFPISTAYCSLSLERIKAEIQKCDVLCSNCHRKRHWDERHELREFLRHSRRMNSHGKSKSNVAS